MFRLVLVAAALAFACGGTWAAKLKQTVVNQAQFAAGDTKGASPTVLKAPDPSGSCAVLAGSNRRPPLKELRQGG